MDFSNTVQCHIKWLTDTLSAMEHTPETMVAEDIARDDLCEIGKWLRDHRAQYADMPEFAAIDKAHIALHTSAAAAVRVAHGGHYNEARKYLSPEGEFIQYSNALLECFERFFEKAGD